MKPLKLKTLWTLDILFDGKMVQVFSSKSKIECSLERLKYNCKTIIQKRKVITDKY